MAGQRNAIVPAPRWLGSDTDGPLLLAATKGAALAEARRYEPLDHIIDVEFVGWMHDVGWDALSFDSQEEFDQESGYASWWESGRPPRDRLVTATCMPGWEVRYCDGCDECAED